MLWRRWKSAHGAHFPKKEMRGVRKDQGGVCIEKVVATMMLSPIIISNRGSSPIIISVRNDRNWGFDRFPLNESIWFDQAIPCAK
jgi:hypothetical protein